MSSPSSPPLTLDVSLRRTERRIAHSALAVAAIAPCLLLGGPVVGRLAIAALLLAAVYEGVRRAGWLAGVSRVDRLSWLPDGRWLIAAGGGDAECELCSSSRVSSRGVWLHLRNRAMRRNYYMLLARGDVAEDDLRRLIVRLRLDAARPQADAG
jgi:hypothetical protein